MEKKFVLIKLLLKFRKLFERSRVDFDMLISILTLKLTLDDRKASFTSGMNNGKKSKLTGMKANLLMQGFFGLFLGIIMFVPFDLFYKISTIAAMDVFFMVMFMVSDFSTVMLDTRDKDIIMTKPVNNETMNTARMIHVIYYMLSLFMALNLIPMGILTFQMGPKIIIAALLMVLFLSFFVIFITTILYSFLLERFSGEKLKDIINVFQVALSIVTVISYQLVGRIFEFIDFEMTINIRWWTYLLPSSWYGGLFKVLVEGDTSAAYVIMSIMGVVVPIAVGVVTLKVILPKYEGYLSKLQVEDGVFIPKTSLKFRIKDQLFRWISSDQKELAFMRFTDSNLSRDRKLKLMILPNHALGFVFPVVMLLPFIDMDKGLYQSLLDLKGTMGYLATYWSVIFMISNVEYIQYSEKFEAAFIYDSFPIPDKRIIYSGAMKAYYVKYIMPVLVFINLIMIALFGIESLVGLLIIDIASALFLIIRFKISTFDLPFSREMNSSGNKNIGAMFGMMFVVGIFGGLHYLFIKNNLIMGLIAAFVLVIFTQLAYVSFLKPQKVKSVKS